MNIRKELIYYSQLSYERSYCAGGEGNCSIRLSENAFLITPSGKLKPRLKTSDLVEIDIDAKILSGKNSPSSERFTHLEIYRQNPGVNAVIHAHPFYSVLATVTGKNPFKQPFLPEAVLFFENICIAPYAAPSTSDGAETIRKLCKKTNAIVIEKHGSFTFGRDLTEAFSLLEMLEKTAKMYYFAQADGTKLSFLTQDEIKRLCSVRQ